MSASADNLTDLPARLNEIFGVVIVFLNTGCDGEDIDKK